MGDLVVLSFSFHLSKSPYSPFGGIEVVGAGAEVIDKTEGMAVVAYEDVSAGGVRWEDDGLAAQIVQSLGE